MITPWYFPVTMVLTALGPLLAAGNTTVVKPSERSPVSTVRLSEPADAVGIPPGVLNLMLRDDHAGAAHEEHEDVQLGGPRPAAVCTAPRSNWAGRTLR
ncbi:aldehyde dehydrogenase family protein [Streptomyces coelicoflavus]|uniref:aldehyde dehydrogenase family protein n=1 Tax=Streptomyces coelicoflavus TaxID=285562 RepID=UPI0036843203